STTMNIEFFYFILQAEDGIRDFHVTGVHTCALPISCIILVKAHVQDNGVIISFRMYLILDPDPAMTFVLLCEIYGRHGIGVAEEIGRASCRERAKLSVVSSIMEASELSPVILSSFRS